MSLLNDTLMDLDKAKRKAAGVLQGEGNSVSSVTNLAHLRQFALPLIAVLVVVSWLVIEKNIFGFMSSHKSVAFENQIVSQKLTAVQQKSQVNVAVEAGEKHSDISAKNGLNENPDNANPVAGTSISGSSETSVTPEVIGSNEDTRAKPLVENIPLPRSEPQSEVKKRVDDIEPKSTMTKPKKNSASDGDYDIRLAEAIHSGRHNKFENKAWSLIESQESSRWTAMALADVYAANKNVGQLLQLVNRVRDRDSVASAYVQSQWLIIHGDLKGAADILEPHRSTPLEYPYVLRLLAGIRSSLNEYSEALHLYRQLTDMPNINVNDWLGYAIALEHEGDVSAARQAYQKISGVPHADRRINRFVNERIRELEKGGNE